MRIAKWLSFLLYFVLCLSSAADKQTATLTLAYVEFPPFTFTNKNGQADGSLLEKAQHIVTLAGYEYKTIALPAKRLIKYLLAGKVDIWIGIKQAVELRNEVLISTQQIGSASLNIYALNNKKVTQLSELHNHKVIILRGYNYGGAIDYIIDSKNNIKTFVTNTHESAFNMLATKRADYLLAYQHPANLALQNIYIEGLAISNLSQLPLYFIISKKTADADIVLAKLEQTLKTIKSND